MGTVGSSHAHYSELPSTVRRATSLPKSFEEMRGKLGIHWCFLLYDIFVIAGYGYLALTPRLPTCFIEVACVMHQKMGMPIVFIKILNGLIAYAAFYNMMQMTYVRRILIPPEANTEEQEWDNENGFLVEDKQRDAKARARRLLFLAAVLCAGFPAMYVIYLFFFLFFLLPRVEMILVILWLSLPVPIMFQDMFAERVLDILFKKAALRVQKVRDDIDNIEENTNSHLEVIKKWDDLREFQVKGWALDMGWIVLWNLSFNVLCCVPSFWVALEHDFDLPWRMIGGAGFVISFLVVFDKLSRASAITRKCDGVSVNIERKQAEISLHQAIVRKAAEMKSWENKVHFSQVRDYFEHFPTGFTLPVVGLIHDRDTMKFVFASISCSGVCSGLLRLVEIYNKTLWSDFALCKDITV